MSDRMVRRGSKIRRGAMVGAITVAALGSALPAGASGLPEALNGITSGRTPAQLQCLGSKGLVAPRAGETPSPAFLASLVQALRECGIDVPAALAALIAHNDEPAGDNKIACLQQQGLTLPAPGQPPTADQIASYKAALAACGIQIPAPEPKRGDGEKRECMESQGITKPAPGQRPTEEQIAAFKAALTACGIEIPTGKAAQRADGARSKHKGAGVRHRGSKRQGAKRSANAASRR